MWSAVLLSSLRPARRYVSHFRTVLGGSNNLIGSRGYASNSNGDTRDTRKRHLYLVLDDHKDGFGVYKLDLGEHEDDLDGGTVRRLTEPPVLLVSLETLGKRVQFAAMGSSIVATGTTLISPVMDGEWVPVDDFGGVLIYNIKTAALTVTSHLPEGLHGGGHKATMAIGNSLYMLGPEPSFRNWSACGGSLNCLTMDPVGTGGDEFWGWERLSGSSTWWWSDFRSPPVLPFYAKYITAHAVHTSPPGATEEHEMLVSLRPTEESVLGATFTFSTTSSTWTERGEWHLPVIGQAYYDDELYAWVGLHAVNGGNMYGPLVTDGHLCVGNVTSPPADWKVSKEKLFRLDEDVAAGWKHVDAKLVAIASGKGRSDYCLMERLRPKGEEEMREEEIEEQEEDEETGDDEDDECWGYGGKCLLRLFSFRVERGQDGEPMATPHRQARSYEVSWHNKNFDAQAFWM